MTKKKDVWSNKAVAEKLHKSGVVVMPEKYSFATGEEFWFNKGVEAECLRTKKEIFKEIEYWQTSTDVNVNVKTRIKDALLRVKNRLEPIK